MTARLFPKKGRPVLVAVLVLFCLTEQVHVVRSSYDKRALHSYIDSIARRVPPACEAFLLVSTGGGRYRRGHDEAAWATLHIERPTINGRYGRFPPGYGGLRNPNARRPEDMRSLEAALGSWLQAHDRNPARSCIVDVPRSFTRTALASIR